MKKILFSAMLAVCGAMLFTSCSNDDVVGADNLGEYQSNFEKVFGQVSPAQNFNTLKTVTIESSVANAQGNYTLRVYDAKPGQKGASLIGKFENLNAGGVSAVKVDVSKAAKNIYCVADDGTTSRLTTSAVPSSGRVTARFDQTSPITRASTDEASLVTLAFEDLGSTNDFDFNDVVITVEYTTGNSTATVTLLALGGVLPVRLYYESPSDQSYSKELFGGKELHEAMGYNVHTMINTNCKSTKGIKGVDNVEPITDEIAIPADFTIGDDGAPFVLSVSGVEGQRKITSSNEYGAVPQVLVIGKQFDDSGKPYYWRWPQETVAINRVYTKIGDWMSDPTNLDFLTEGVDDSKLYDGYNPNEDEEPAVTTPEGLEAVDLGLPSGTLWANMNVGATAPEEYGSYFAWGETEEKDVYDWSTYIHCDGSFDTCHDLGSDIAGTEYDVAHVKWGGNWQMPTYDQIQELLDNTTSTWTTQNGVNGRLFTATNGNSIFLPAAGYRWYGNLGAVGDDGYCWSSNPYASFAAFALGFYSDNANWAGGDRECGRSVRPVITPKKEETTTLDALEAIDLGLPSGTKWANMNVGATTPEEYGSYFAWGETEVKDVYDWSTYKWMNEGQSDWTQINKYTFADGQTDGCWYSDGEFVGDNLSELLPEDDAATANWGSDWQMPSLDQITELLDNTTSTRTTQNGVEGLLFTASNGNSIFLPAAGYRRDGNLHVAGSRGYYWSRSLGTDISDFAYLLNFGSGRTDSGYHRNNGLSVRPVRVQN